MPRRATAQAFMSFPIGAVGYTPALSLHSGTALKRMAVVYERSCEMDIELRRTAAGMIAGVPDLAASLSRLRRYDELGNISRNQPGWVAEIERILQDIASEPRLMTVR